MDDKLSRDILNLEDYIDTYLFAPSIEWWKDAFDVQVYSRWTAYEILERMILEESKLPQHISGVEIRSSVDIIDEFIDEVEYFYEVSHNDNQRFIFHVAVSTAASILALFERRK